MPHHYRSAKDPRLFWQAEVEGLEGNPGGSREGSAGVLIIPKNGFFAHGAENN